MRDACSGRPGDDVARADRDLLIAEETRPLAVEDDEELLFGRVAMRRAVELARSDERVVEPRSNRPCSPPELPERVAELPPRLLLGLDLVDVDDPRWPRARRWQIRLAEGGVERPLVTPATSISVGPTRIASRRGK